MAVDDSGRVGSLKFSIWSPKEILSESSGEIYYGNRSTSSEATLNDPRLGATKTTINAITGLTDKNDPGLFGHCNLPVPVYHPILLEAIKGVANAVCPVCSSLRKLKTPDLVAQLKALSHNHRLSYFNNKLLKAKDNQCVNPECTADLPKILADKSAQFTSLVFKYSGDKKGKKERKEPVTSKRIYDILVSISDEDSELIGFQPDSCRPEWMLITVLPIAPINIRPAVVSDNDKTSEDDITLIYNSILKTSQELRDLINEKKGSAEKHQKEVREKWQCLQWYVACLIDNETNSYNPATNRSHRPLKTIKQRHKGKHGRIRGNLSGKRVNECARSVITPDPLLSINQLGVPREIAMILTYPEIVTVYNIQAITTLARRGPKNYPGANSIQKPGQTYTVDLGVLSDLDTLTLTIGTIVYRHMIDGDIVVFNRQPSLHKASMMAHYAKILPGRSFRLPVNATNPYNADFDGDEMNLHFPQSEKTRRELELQALCSTQICSPQANKPIMGAVQDTLVGIYRSSSEQSRGYAPDERYYINPRNFMKLVYTISNYRGMLPEMSSPSGWTTRQLYNTFMPPITITSGDFKIVNGVVNDPQTGKLPPITKKLAGPSAAGGLFHVAWNDLGHMAAAALLDNMSKITTKWLEMSGFSVGLRDMILRDESRAAVKEIKAKYQKDSDELLHGLSQGRYEETRTRVLGQPRGLTNNDYEQFEVDLMNVLRTAKSKVEELTMKNIKLDKDGNQTDNRCMSMVDAGSKGSATNIVQICSMLGQQEMQGHRVTDSYPRRPLPLMPKDCLDPHSRGYISGNFLEGLDMVEYVFHAMAGRNGVISRAISTADTGYLQRRLMKLMEDAVIRYGGTCRNASGAIINYCYAGDGFNAAKVEPQKPAHSGLSLDELQLHYRMGAKDWEIINYTPTDEDKDYAEKEYTALKTDYMECRSRNIRSVLCPINFRRLIDTVIARLGVVATSVKDTESKEPTNRATPTYISQKMLLLKSKLNVSTNPYINSQSLKNFFIVMRSRINIKSMMMKHIISRAGIDLLCEEIYRKFYEGIIAPGEACGAIAAQCIGEPSTQMTLDTFHSTGAKASVAGGIPRITEITNLTSNQKTPSATIYLKNLKLQGKALTEYDAELEAADDPKKLKAELTTRVLSESVMKIKTQFETLFFRDLVTATEFLYIPEIIADTETDPDYEHQSRGGVLQRSEPNSWVIRFSLNEDLFIKHITIPTSLGPLLQKEYGKGDLKIRVFSTVTPPILRVELREITSGDPLVLLNDLEEDLKNIKLKGIEGVEKISASIVDRDILGDTDTGTESYIYQDDERYEKAKYMTMRSDDYVLNTVGSNLADIMTMSNVDTYRTYSNNIREMCDLYGIEVARQLIINELNEVMKNAGASLDPRHLGLLADVMTTRGIMQSVDRYGIRKGDAGPLARASFEETTPQLAQACMYGEIDNMQGVSAGVIFGQTVKLGTGSFDILMDEAMIAQYAKTPVVQKKDIALEIIDQGDVQQCADDKFSFDFTL